MIVTLQTQRVQALEQVRRVAEGNEPVEFTLAERAPAGRGPGVLKHSSPKSLGKRAVIEQPGWSTGMPPED